VKVLVYKCCKQLGHKADIEYDTCNGDIFDVVDWNSKLVYEPLQPFSSSVILNKTARYTLVTGVDDMIPIDLRKFDLKEPVEVWIDRIKNIVV